MYKYIQKVRITETLLGEPGVREWEREREQKSLPTIVDNYAGKKPRVLCAHGKITCAYIVLSFVWFDDQIMWMYIVRMYIVWTEAKDRDSMTFFCSEFHWINLHVGLLVIWNRRFDIVPLCKTVVFVVCLFVCCKASICVSLSVCLCYLLGSCFFGSCVCATVCHSTRAPCRYIDWRNTNTN